MLKTNKTANKLSCYLLVMGVFLINLILPVQAAEILDEWRVTNAGKGYIGFVKKSNGDSFSCVRLASSLVSTKQVAGTLSREMHGFDLKPVPSLRGWKFGFISDRMCGALVTKLGQDYEYIWQCGEVSQDEIRELLIIAHQQLDKM